jgi:uncharacterized protein YndB with AHSA1/START domain
LIAAPRQLVWQAWTDPVHVAQWWGPNGFTSPRCDIDARTGGAIRIEMLAPDGTIYPMSGRFQEIVPIERLVFQSSALDDQGRSLFDVLNTVTFAAEGDATRLTLEAKAIALHHANAPDYLKGMDQGWRQSIERFAAACASLPASDREMVITRVIEAPRPLVWQAWTDPSHLPQWWGPKGFSCETKEIDIRPGGVWRFTMIGPDGTRYPSRISYQEIVPPERIIYVIDDDDHGMTSFGSTAIFEDLGETTRVTMRVTFDSAETRKSMLNFGALEGGRSTLECLAEHVKNMMETGAGSPRP